MKAMVILSGAVSAATATNIPGYVSTFEQAAFNAAIRALPSFGSFEPEMGGFQKPFVIPSVGGNATCIQGNIPVQASALNTHLNYSEPSSAMDLTNTVLNFIQTDSTFSSQVLQEPNQVSGTYNINSKICFPSATNKINNDLPLQFLIHGVGFDKSYWDFYSPQYSYADYMASAGYTTFFYDRLGVGESDHPDPLQTVQSALEVSIAHALIQKLRNGDIASTKFHRLVGVGHSYGSIQINGITNSYPKDLDAAVLTGFSTSEAGVGAFLSALNLDVASANQPQRFHGLPNAYTCSSSQISNQLGFFHYPDFDPAVLTAAERNKGTFALGELFTLSAVAGPAPEFTGPVDVVDGSNDLPFCQGNCRVPSDQAELVLKALYPSAAPGSRTFLAQGAGHGVNLHYVAPQAYEQIRGFLGDNGL